jgi:hypothetical protein
MLSAAQRPAIPCIEEIKMLFYLSPFDWITIIIGTPILIIMIFLDLTEEEKPKYGKKSDKTRNRRDE